MKIAFTNLTEKRAFTRRDATFEPQVSKDYISGSTLGRLSFQLGSLRNQSIKVI